MDKFTRKIGGKKREFVVFTKEEADEEHIAYVPWREAKGGDLALTDDGFVGDCLSVTTYRNNMGKFYLYKNFSFGKAWMSPNSKLLYGPRRFIKDYSHVTPRTWQEHEVKRTRTKNAVGLYTAYIMAGQPVDWDKLGMVYRKDQKVPAMTVRRLFKQEKVREMVNKEIARQAALLGINEEYILALMKKAANVAEMSGDAGAMIRAAVELRDTLDLGPTKDKNVGGDWLTAGIDAETSRSLEEAQKEFAKPPAEEAQFEVVHETPVQ